MEHEDYNTTLNLERIISGEDVVNHIPWQVSIQAYNAPLNQWDHFCGGTILNQYTILSAAHCFYGSYVRQGQHIKRQHTTTLRIVAGTPFTQISGDIERFPNVQVSLPMVGKVFIHFPLYLV